MKSEYKRTDLGIGVIVHAKTLSGEHRLGFITSFSKSPDNEDSICYVDKQCTFINEIDQVVTKVWYEMEKLKAKPFSTWLEIHKSKIKYMMEGYKSTPVSQEWEGAAYPSGFAWTGD